MKLFRYLLLITLLFSGLFAQNTAYDQVLENISWKDKVKVRLVENNDSTYSVSPNMADGSGNPISSIDGNLDVGNFYLKVAKGEVSGHKLKSKFGRNPTVGTSGFDTIWNGGGSYTGFDATGAEIVTIVSSSADDNSTGTGLRTIRIFGLDTNYLEQTEDINLSGIIEVNTTLSYIRLDTVKGLEAGTGKVNAGDITIRQSVTTAVIFAVVPAGYNSSMIAAYTIPAGKTGYLISQSAGISNKQAAAVAIRMQARSPGSVFTVQGEAALNSIGTGFIERSFILPKQIPEKTDIFIEAEASAEVAVSAFLEILLVDN